MRWICQTNNDTPQVINADRAVDAAAKVLYGERARYTGQGNYYLPPIVFSGELSGIVVRVWLRGKIRQTTASGVVHPRGLKNMCRWI
jgi:hypothetical protein